ncbi:hypothetical protein ACFY93_14260 [Streptomyces sp. NPDC008313]|uniref:hypothetical protein n=1 Tax=Streptomyces sp. NPDC008313 TaxID=3364826 RepID=UPI0036E0C922
MVLDRHVLTRTPRGLRRRALCHRAWGAGAAMLGIALVVAAGIGLAAVPDLMDDEQAFHTARPCSGTVVGDCLREVRATVRGTVIRDRAKDSEHTLKLAGPRPVPAELDMGSSEPLLERLKAGDMVMVTVWRDYATAVSKDGLTQRSADTPEGEPLIAASVAVALLSCGLFAALAGGVVLARAPTYAAEGLPGLLVLRGKQALGSALCAFPASVFGTWTGPWGVVALWAVLSGAVWGLMRRLESRRAGRHTRQPTPSR